MNALKILILDKMRKNELTMQKAAADIGISVTTLQNFLYHDQNIGVATLLFILDYFRIDIKFVER